MALEDYYNECYGLNLLSEKIIRRRYELCYGKEG